MINCLKLAAQEGMTVVAVIHQPRTSVFELFDDLILLGRSSATLGGRTVYSGPANAAQRYFEYRGFLFSPQENPADLFIDIVSGSYSFDSRVVLKGMTGGVRLSSTASRHGGGLRRGGGRVPRAARRGGPEAHQVQQPRPAPADSPRPPTPAATSTTLSGTCRATPRRHQRQQRLLTPKRAVANQQPAPFSGGPQTTPATPGSSSSTPAKTRGGR